jgi:hypothetical protein
MQSDTLLLRQIHPNWVRESRATSAAFYPTQKDDGKLSVSDGTKISPQEAWEKHTTRLHSEGTMAITVGESEGQKLVIEPDPLPNQEEHVLLNFVNLTTHSQIKSAAKMLALMANNRGWLYRKT